MKPLKQCNFTYLNAQAKSITHNPEIFAQFGSFNLKPPVSTKEVQAVVDSLKEQQVRSVNLIIHVSGVNVFIF